MVLAVCSYSVSLKINFNSSMLDTTIGPHLRFKAVINPIATSTGRTLARLIV